MKTKLQYLETMTSEIINQAEGLNAVLNAFESEFISDREPEAMAAAILENPKTYQFLIYVAEMLVSEIIEDAKSMQELQTIPEI